MSLVDSVKTVYELAKKGATIDLQERLMEIREEAVALQEENLALRERVSELESAAAINESISFDGAVYWLEDEGGCREGPYCQRCYDVDRSLVRLQSHQYTFKEKQHYRWQCRACDKSYEDNAR